MWAGGPASDTGGFDVVTDRRNLPMTCWVPNLCSSVKISFVPLASVIGSLISKAAALSLPKLRRRRPASPQVVVDGVRNREAFLREEGLRPLQRHRPRLRLRFVAPASRRHAELGQHEVAVAAPGPAPCAGRLGSGSTSRRMAVMPFSGVVAVTRVGVRGGLLPRRQDRAVGLLRQRRPAASTSAPDARAAVQTGALFRPAPTSASWRMQLLLVRRPGPCLASCLAPRPACAA